MNDLIKRELLKVKVAKIPPFDDNTIHIHIKKGLNVNEFRVGGGYAIALYNVLVNPPKNFSFHINWNRGVVPKSRFLKCYVVEKMSSMIKVDALLCDENFNDNGEMWSGWLPIEYLDKVGDL